jgi:hypothetical protein
MLPVASPTSAELVLSKDLPHVFSTEPPQRPISDLLTPVEDDGVLAVERPAGAPLLAGAREIDRVLEACFAAEFRAALRYAENLPPAFFDLSSGEAGTILQKLRNYGVRLAVVQAPGASPASSRFGEVVAEERMRGDFAVFASRADARAWLAS